MTGNEALSSEVGEHITIGMRAFINGLYGGMSAALRSSAPFPVKAILTSHSFALGQLLGPVGEATAGQNLNYATRGAQFVASLVAGAAFAGGGAVIAPVIAAGVAS